MKPKKDDKNQGNQLPILGLMSGTSCDGIDLCRVVFEEVETATGHSSLPTIEYTLEDWMELPYSSSWKERIEQAHQLPLLERKQLGRSYTQWLIETLQQLPEPWLEVAALGFHGPTLFHSVADRYSEQLGDFQMLADGLQIPVVADFRTDDLQLGGRGAPLVPFGDAVLFSQYDACVNLGGFANFSLQVHHQTLASDSSICNYAMDRLSQRVGKAFDANGDLARAGHLLPDLLEQLESEMQRNFPVALTREWAESRIFPLLKEGEPCDLLHTIVTHCALQLQKHLTGCSKVLLSGGGARNKFLVERIQQFLPGTVEVASADVLAMKEALIFALLAWRRQNNANNVLASATGASQDHSAGKIFQPQETS